MTMVQQVRQWAHRRPVTVDAALGAVLLALAFVAQMRGVGERAERGLTGRDAVALLIMFAALTVRRVHPRIVLIATAVAAVTLVALTGHRQPALLIAVVVCTYTMASSADRRSAWVTGAGVAAGTYLADALISSGTVWAPGSLGLIAWIGMATAAGDATRSRRAYVAEVEARAVRAEETREEEAARRVFQERVRIARELHDVVAHHIAVINVQAGAASHVLARSPELVQPALTHIRDACGTVLHELASIVGVLRQPGDPTSTTEPAPGLVDLSDLIDSVTAAGLVVQRRQIGVARELPAVVDLAAYRIVQEALTNAHKYGTRTASLTVTYSPRGITIDVVNAVGAGHSSAGSGYGIIGMRERAASTGGILAAGLGADGRFAVHAELPAPVQELVP